MNITKQTISDTTREKNKRFRRKFFDYFYCSALFFSIFFSALWITWWPLTFYDYGYSIAYELLSIDQTIDQYGPLNRYRQHFEKTSRDEHERLFKEIVISVNKQGEGLEAITYHDQSGQPITTLLRQPEIIHLIDVSTLVSDWTKWGVFFLPLSILLGLNRKRLCSTTLSPAKLAATAAAWFILCLALTFLFGPTTVFYFFHEQWFPSEHQWFFYYQESLMTTLMKAPDLFGWIGCLWTILSGMLLSMAWCLWHFIGKRIRS